MTLRIFNTQSGAKEEFQPIEPGKVRLYVCGITAYDYCHIGHARANVVFDVLFRYLKALGYEVTYVRNYTDIDDKIINRANELKVGSRELAERFMAAFAEDMARLGCETPSVEPKATENISHIIAIIRTLIGKGMAYEAGGDVYFSIRDFPGYLKLSKRNLDEMLSGARIAPGEQKRDPMDFALWKAAKPGEPSWESPWGPGRPGWHIECSAMSMRYLGPSIDIHGGGKDLVFPHHENEIAQSEGATGQPFARYWVHNGFVNINQEKMSKSLGNFFTVREVLEKYDPEVLRFFILSAHYRSPIDFSDKNLEDARHGLSRIYEALLGLGEVLDSGAAKPAPEAGFSAEDEEIWQPAERLRENFAAAMDDDFNTAQALGQIFEAVRAVNRVLAERRFEANGAWLRRLAAVRDRFRGCGEVLGLFQAEPASWLERIKDAGLGESGLSKEAIEALIVERQEARKAKNFARADAIRDELAAKGVILLDSPQGTTWKTK
ncbi:MAG: cysteine--tRNA ligase [Deltaproteobacteria bacterium]|nr:cysteine--tRNA ligase [Deltaproteobacteria bacterium]